jgi:fumarate reductase flavoprotein subunit
LGLRSVVLEKGEAELYACNSRYSGGIFHIAYNEVKKPPEVLFEAIRKATEGHAHDQLAHAIAADAGRLVDWLRQHGARFINASQVDWERWLLAPPPPMQTGLNWQGRGPDVLLRSLVAQLIKSGGSIERGARATAIHPGADSIDVVAQHAGAEAHWTGRTVLIADGGFQSNAEMFRAYIGPRPDLVKQRNAATGCGDGARMAVAAGAALTPMDHFYGHLLAQEAMTKDTLWPYPQMDRVAVAAIIVDREGNRVLDEGCGGVELANRLARLDDPACATIVFDAAIWEGPGRAARVPPNPSLELAGATVYRADTLAALASSLGMPAERLIKTVSQYNNALATNQLGDLAPARRTDLHDALPIRKAPFMAVRICAGITYTMGGIAIDEHARVLRPDGSVIDRLYAAGASTGGIEGGGSIGGYVGGLSKAGILGLRAAEHAATRLAR